MIKSKVFVSGLNRTHLILHLSPFLLLPTSAILLFPTFTLLFPTHLLFFCTSFFPLFPASFPILSPDILYLHTFLPKSLYLHYKYRDHLCLYPSTQSCNTFTCTQTPHNFVQSRTFPHTFLFISQIPLTVL